jgi:hypothetical protein
MAFDERLADRIRVLLDGEPGLTEKKMFGGLAFLLAGHMTVTASGHGGLMVRVDPAEAAPLVDSTPAHQIEMRGRPMTGWLYLEAPDVEDDAELAAWVRRAVAVTRSLPAK